MTLPAQDTWQTPPEPIAAMLDTPQLPDVGFSPNAKWIVEFSQAGLPPIEELTVPVVALAGLQINPNTWGPAKAGYYVSLSVRRAQGVSEGEPTHPITGLPAGARIRDLSWSDDSRYLAFTHTQLSDTDDAKSGISLWILDIESAKAIPLTGPIVNATCASPFHWLPDNTLVCKVRTDAGPPPAKSPLPIGPIIEQSLGRTAPARTYTNLLQSPHDEVLLEYYLSSQIVKIELSGKQTPVTQSGLFKGFAPSPDGNWLKVISTHRPFSYQVPLTRFPKRTDILNLNGEIVYTLADLPLAEEISINFDSVRDGKRASGWRADKPATLYWIEALDGGDARVESDYRDSLFTLDAPFTAVPNSLWKTTLRYNSIEWGNGSTAIAYEAMYNTRQLRTWWLSPEHPQRDPHLIEERNFQDAYSNPGEPVTHLGAYGWHVLQLSKSGDIYLNGRGASPQGVYPFLDKLNLSTGEKERLWQAGEVGFSRVRRLLDADAEQLIIAKENKSEPSNYWLHDRKEGTEKLLTNFKDPLPWYEHIHKEIVRYNRADGLELSGTLYLPPGHDPQRDGPLPTILWVYPEEHKSRATASQVTRAENTFGRPQRTSVMFLLTQGYAVLSGPTMPIIGEGDTEPNDTYLEQLVDSAKAAVDYLIERGVSQKEKLAIGGHSYGAFTTANLLAHTQLFAAGIARSGAYNRSLTPFGFQGEQRNFWDATETYMKMSPFTHADKIKYPLLLIHGAADNNSGTYPIQSDRLYEAIKGLGGTVRYVSLPFEEHGYRSREAVGHVLWEMVQWLDTYVKGKQ
ncbi:MAG: prolyl oligopeptidase family serine peptidase [Phormidesmis sp.]